MAEKTSKDEVVLTNEQFQALMERLNKLENAPKVEEYDGNKVPQHLPGVGALGQNVGVIQKFSVDPSDYIDPRNRLSELKELVKFAFTSNYFLTWDVEQLQYDTKYGTTLLEPRFRLRLYKRLFDDDGEPTLLVDKLGNPILDEQGRKQYKSYLVKQAFFFEDPGASLAEAHAMGLPVDKSNSAEFLEEMRYHRYKAWLLGIFYPKKPDNQRSKEQMVIGSSVVEVESYSEDA